MPRLADAENEEDLSLKLAGLQAVWDNIARGFDHWFKKGGQIFS